MCPAMLTNLSTLMAHGASAIAPNRIRHVFVLIAGVHVKYRGCYHLSAPALCASDTAAGLEVGGAV